MITFSVITICRNDLEGLRQTYDSLRVQRDADWEWIVADGASTDGTVQWLAALPPGTANWISEPDKGWMDAMNKGLERATGEYVVFMNSGDRFADERVLEDVRACADAAPQRPWFIYGDSYDSSPDSERLRPARHHSWIGRGMFTHHQSMFFARSHIDSLRYDLSFRLSADYGFVAAFLSRTPDAAIQRLPRPLSRFLFGGMSMKQRKRALKEDMLIRQRVLGYSTVHAVLLYAAHWVHTMMKQYVPGVTAALRYRVRS